MAYCTVAELKEAMSLPIETSGDTIADPSGEDIVDERWDDTFLESVIDASAEFIDGYFGEFATISATSKAAKMLNIYHAAMTLITMNEKPIPQASTRSKKMLDLYKVWEQRCIDAPGILGTAVGPKYEVGQ
jgi:hypothetical protein